MHRKSYVSRFRCEKKKNIIIAYYFACGFPHFALAGLNEVKGAIKIIAESKRNSNRVATRVEEQQTRIYVLPPAIGEIMAENVVFVVVVSLYVFFSA